MNKVNNLIEQGKLAPLKRTPPDKPKKANLPIQQQVAPQAKKELQAHIQLL